MNRQICNDCGFDNATIVTSAPLNACGNCGKPHKKPAPVAVAEPAAERGAKRAALKNRRSNRRK